MKRILMAGAATVLLAGNAMADISGKVYEGRLNAGQLQPIVGVQVVITDTTAHVRLSVTTDSSGFYEFTSVDVTGYNLEALADSHWSALKESIQNGECYVILPQRVGDLSEMKSLHNTPIVPNGHLMSQRRFGQPIAVYFDKISTSDAWTEPNKNLVRDRMNYHEQLLGKDFYVEVYTQRNTSNPGINIRYDADGVSNTSPLIIASDVYNAYVLFANVTLRDGDLTGAVADKELFAMCNNLGYPIYEITCSRSPPYEISDKDVMYFNVCDDFRPVFLTVRSLYSYAQITCMNDLGDSVPTAVEDPFPGNVPGAPLTILSIMPNPFNPSAEVSFERRGSGQVNMEIYDVRGKRVRTVALGILGPGLHRVRWDGRDIRGHNVASGIYFVRLHSTQSESRAVKAVLMR